MKVSPAPTVSTALTLKPGTWPVNSGVSSHTPFAPSVTSTRGQAERILMATAAPAALAASRTSEPLSLAASFSLGIIQSQRCSNASPTGAKGAGFKMAGTRASRARRKVASTESSGVSSCTTTAFDCANKSRCACTSAAVSVSLAPLATTIWFCPVASRTIIAVPLATSARCATPRVLTPASIKFATISSPNASWPTAPIMAAAMPMRAIA